MFEDYFRDIMSPYFEFQKFNSCCRLIHLGGLNFNYLLFVQKCRHISNFKSLIVVVG